jgi:hypothetical protein
MIALRRFDRLSLLGFVLLALVLPLGACSPGGTPMGPGPGGSGTGENSSAFCNDAIDNDEDGRTDCGDSECTPFPWCGGMSGVDSGPPIIRPGTDAGLEECAALVGTATAGFAPVDIIWALDNSGSMDEEASLVQDQINGFASSIFMSGIDYRVMVITAPGFVNVPPPLGTDAEHFLRVDADVQSHNAFEVLLAQWPTYSPFMRAGSAVHIIVVTDDESDMNETEFKSRMEANLGAGRTFTFHAVASEDTTHCPPPPIPCFIMMAGCAGPHGEAADIGHTYYRLAALTGGQTHSICAADWSPLFTRVRDSVVSSASIPCVYTIPDPPAGETFDPTKVNVTFTNGAGVETTLPRAIDEARCTSATGMPERAWFYDNNDAPTRINLCPAACDFVGSDAAGRLVIVLGCDTGMILI